MLSPHAQSANSAGDRKVWLGSWTVRVDPAAVSRATLDALAERHGLEVIGTVGGLDDTFFLHRRCRKDERMHCRHRREEDSTLSIAAHPGVLEGPPPIPIPQLRAPRSCDVDTTLSRNLCATPSVLALVGFFIWHFWFGFIRVHFL